MTSTDARNLDALPQAIVEDGEREDALSNDLYEDGGVAPDDIQEAGQIVVATHMMHGESVDMSDALLLTKNVESSNIHQDEAEEAAPTQTTTEVVEEDIEMMDTAQDARLGKVLLCMFIL